MTIQTQSVAAPRIGRRPRNLWSDAWDRLRANRMAMVGLMIVALLFVVAIFGPHITPYDPLVPNYQVIAQPPTWDHPLGTDQIGRDYLSRILSGARTAVLVATMVTVASVVIGSLVGALSAYMGGVVDFLFMRLVDVLMTFPHILLAAFVNVTAKPVLQRLIASISQATGRKAPDDTLMLDYLVVFGALALVNWPGMARLVRGQVLSLREQEFIQSQRAIGAPTFYVVLRHLIPNALGPIVVAATVAFGGAMLLESALSFLGVGIQPPAASWGMMINDSLPKWRYQPHLVAVPGIILAIVVFGFNYLGDGLNDALNPASRRR